MVLKIINMQFMRYINLFRKISYVSTTDCFVYNNTIIFAVPRDSVAKAIGKNGVNMKKIGEILRKKIKVIEMPQECDSENDLKNFIGAIIDPITFNKMDVRDNLVTISAGRQSKAALIGRGRTREKELSDILSKSFGKSLRIA